ncbi:MAG TPA: plasmid mobilization relaxosome protein MobC, partial [Nitrospira sp.]|nr:plasmid mobilization relaxosome protein MobC [Nitrospira sp.]
MVVRRDKLLTIKTTEAERSAWQAEATAAGLTLADLIRERMSA